MKRIPAVVNFHQYECLDHEACELILDDLHVLIGAGLDDANALALLRQAAELLECAQDSLEHSTW